MKFAVFASALALTSTASAAAVRCLNTQSATKIVNRFIGIQNKQGSDLGNAAVTADRLIANNYKEYSDSILMLQGKPLGEVTFSSKKEYVAGVLNAPAVPSIETIKVYVSGCNKILWQWQFDGIGTGEYPVKGFNLFTVNSQNQISKTEVEFNSLAWYKDVPSAPAAPAEPETETEEPETTETTEETTAPDTTSTDDTSVPPATTDDTEEPSS